MLPNLKQALRASMKSDDFMQTTVVIQDKQLFLSFYKTLVSHEQLHHDLLSFLMIPNEGIDTLDDLKALIPLENITLSSDLTEIRKSVSEGSIFLQLDDGSNDGLIVDISDPMLGHRINNDTENEYSVLGPKVGFVENIDINLSLLRRGLGTEKLIFEEHKIGTLSRTRVVIAYMEDVTNPQHINTARQRLLDLDFDVVFETALLEQLITDNSNSPFPLFLSSERLDRIMYSLINGEVAIICDGSPSVITGPTTIFSFIISPEDYYLPWIMGSFFRLIRYFGVAFSILATSFYVAILTFHYNIIPRDLLGPIIESRSNVPFPPLLEVLFLEITIELLREAGSRLPTKVSQTLGIVGGIILGQAAVAAGLTSNILLIIVSLSALASFTTPIFKISNTIRFLRFPLIVLAYLWGGLGIMMGLILILGHLLRLKSLGSPYIVPLFPFRYNSFSDSIVRSSFTMLYNRFFTTRPLTQQRYTVRKNKDIGDDYNNE
ncbi:GerA spore germination protein [Paenibacillus taihuensis]|uniref:GerA spore germination protein n=1 Tax=Paenibacillus taihuensis TaxID=1156355 RepID=A0A3D9S7G0_9BACL|nr:spore germination protein [Paenibacillus taihuensis]REE88964.1 GerA spore germination protein [Paenibacillus taihuensis]